ncbi:MAG: 50S ribosomal protein L35 [Phycisphaerales bacterium]|nr:50S ribosomal protein L35 [Phycisphaerales bacterium]
MPKQKTHKGLAKRVKVTKSGKVMFHSPNSRHLKSNKRGTTVQTYRKARFARSGDMKMYGKLLNRSLLSEQQHEAKALAAASNGKTAAVKPAAKTPVHRGAKKVVKVESKKAESKTVTKAAKSS